MALCLGKGAEFSKCRVEGKAGARGKDQASGGQCGAWLSPLRHSLLFF